MTTKKWVKRPTELGNYHQSPAMSSSEVACFLQDPIEWYHVYKLKDWPKKKPTPAMEFGTLVHRMFEQGDFDGLDIVKKPEGMSFATKEGKAWRDEHAGLTIVDAEDFQCLRTIWDNSQRNEWISAAISEGEMESELHWNDEDFGHCRCKPDCQFSLGLIDWKTTSKTTERGFIYEILDRNYDVRMALYRRGIIQTTGSIPPPVFLVAIQTSGGCELTPYEIDSEWMDDAEARLILAVDEMKNFSLAQHCNREPKRIRQPRFSEVSFNEE